MSNSSKALYQQLSQLNQFFTHSRNPVEQQLLATEMKRIRQQLVEQLSMERDLERQRMVEAQYQQDIDRQHAEQQHRARAQAMQAEVERQHEERQRIEFLRRMLMVTRINRENRMARQVQQVADLYDNQAETMVDQIVGDNPSFLDSPVPSQQVVPVRPIASVWPRVTNYFPVGTPVFPPPTVSIRHTWGKKSKKSKKSKTPKKSKPNHSKK